MRRKRAQRIVNEAYPKGDPRRWEPGLNSVKRIGLNWRQRWHETLSVRAVGQLESIKQ